MKQITFAEEEIINKKQLLYIKTYHHPIDIGSELTCYSFTRNKVIKLFELPSPNINEKLFLDNTIHGNNTFIFTDKIIIYLNNIIGYTMNYIRGPKLGSYLSVELFYNQDYPTIESYIDQIIKDSSNLAKDGIEIFDCYKKNIILSPTGFRQIDCIDFHQTDKEEKSLSKYNIELFLTSIWNELIINNLHPLIKNTNLTKEFFISDPISFLKELKHLSENYSNTKIESLLDTKKLIRKK